MNGVDLVAAWLVVLISVYGFFLAFLKVRHWWTDHITGPDPIDYYRRA